jgi:hypothetical protein
MQNKYFFLLLFLFSCNSVDKNINIPQSLNKANISLLIEQKKASGEIVPIGPKAVKKLSINGFELPLNKLLENQLKINIDNLTLGKHEFEMSLYFLNQDIKIPIIVPNINIKEIPFLIRININEKTNTLNKIEYGYDIDKNGTIDKDKGIFETSDGKKFFVNLPNNQKLEINLAFEKIINTSENNLIPPGAMPFNPPQNIDTNITQRNDINPPKPIINNDNIYPILPLEEEKKE